MPKPFPQIPIDGFEARSELVHVREPGPGDAPPADHPEIVLVFGWGDCLPKHVAKIAAGFIALYPRSLHVVILGPIWESIMSSVPDRIDSMRPVVDALDYHARLEAKGGVKPRILAHTMSNTGAGNYAVTCQGFRQRFGHALPHDLLVHDSTPGSPWMTAANLVKWSRAMTVGTAGMFPWPKFVTQGLWGTFLVTTRAYGYMAGKEFAGVYAERILSDERYETKDAKRLFLYSKEDDLISHEDVLYYAGVAQKAGWETRTELFEGSGHVGHMRMHPEQYWRVLADAWAWTLDKSSAEGAPAPAGEAEAVADAADAATDDVVIEASTVDAVTVDPKVAVSVSA